MKTDSDSPLRGNFWSYQRDLQCKPFVVGHSLRARAFVQCGG